MADFTRMLKPKFVSYPSFPMGYADRGRGGKGQFRESMNVGRYWEEEYIPTKFPSDDFSAFMAYVNNLYRTQTIFTIEHYDLKTLLGDMTGASTPLLKGAGQTGSTILIDGLEIVPTGTALLKAGDIIKIAGRNPVYDILSFSHDGAGNGTIEINPPLWEMSGWDSDNKAITTNRVSGSVKFRCTIDVSFRMPSRDYNGVYTGLIVPFREAP